MSRSLTRDLLVAPLLATVLMLSACGGDDASDGASAAAPPATTAASDLASTPTTPTETTPVSTPEASADDAKKSKKNGKDEATPSPEPVATDAPAATPAATDPPQPEAKQKLRPSAERAQNEVLKVLTAIETCWTTTSDYSKCDSVEQIAKFGGDVVDTKRPKPTETAITRSTKSTFKIISTDKSGTRWVLTKFKSGEVTRKCKRASGKVCNPSTW